MAEFARMQTFVFGLFNCFLAKDVFSEVIHINMFLQYLCIASEKWQQTKTAVRNRKNCVETSRVVTSKNQQAVIEK